MSKMLRGMPVLVFRSPIITVKDPIMQLTGLIILMLAEIRPLFVELFLVDIGNIMKLHYFLIISI